MVVVVAVVDFVALPFFPFQVLASPFLSHCFVPSHLVVVKGKVIVEVEGR